MKIIKVNNVINVNHNGGLAQYAQKVKCNILTQNWGKMLHCMEHSKMAEWIVEKLKIHLISFTLFKEACLMFMSIRNILVCFTSFGALRRWLPCRTIWSTSRKNGPLQKWLPLHKNEIRLPTLACWTDKGPSYLFLSLSSLPPRRHSDDDLMRSVGHCASESPQPWWKYSLCLRWLLCVKLWKMKTSSTYIVNTRKKFFVIFIFWPK